MITPFIPPTIFSLSKTKDQRAFEILLSKQNPAIVDTYDNQVKELFEIRNPQYIDNQKERIIFEQIHFQGRDRRQCGVWIYFPWKNICVHLLEEKLFYEVRTARNFPLLSKKLQRDLAKLTIAVIGLSVGNSVTATIALSGMGKVFKLADGDCLALSNLNRVRAGVTDLGKLKTSLIAEELYEMNPFVKLILYPEGVNKSNFREFFQKDGIPDFLIEECDDVELKFQVRLATRALRVPLLSVTDKGFDADLTVLEFDKNPSAGNMENTPDLSFTEIADWYENAETIDLSESQKLLLVAQLIEQQQTPPEMKEATVLRAEKQLGYWPQLGFVASAGAALAAYAITAILKEERVREQSSLPLHHFLSNDPRAMIEQKFRSLLHLASYM